MLSKNHLGKNYLYSFQIVVETLKITFGNMNSN